MVAAAAVWTVDVALASAVAAVYSAPAVDAAAV